MLVATRWWTTPSFRITHPPQPSGEACVRPAVPGPQVVVELATHRFARRRFRDLPRALHPGRPPRLSDDPDRFRTRRDPWFDGGGRAASLLARLAGDPVPVGRCTAHHLEGSEQGWFGFLDTVDDEERGAAAVAALVRWAARLLAEEGCTSLTGPASYRPDQEAGVQEGDADEVTGRPRTPAWLGPALRSAGLAPGEGRPTWRVAVADVASGAMGEAPHLAKGLPRTIRPWADPRLLLAEPGGGRIVAVPDVAGPWRDAGGPLGLAARVSKRRWDTAVVLELEGDPAVVVPALAARAASAGYRDLVTPWAPAGAGKPEALHRLYSKRLEPPPTGP